MIDEDDDNYTIWNTIWKEGYQTGLEINEVYINRIKKLETALLEADDGLGVNERCDHRERKCVICVYIAMETRTKIQDLVNEIREKRDE